MDAACAVRMGFNPAATSGATVPLASVLIFTSVVEVSAVVPVRAPLAYSRKATRSSFCA